jgi:Transmembrane amino acid transporter protein
MADVHARLKTMNHSEINLKEDTFIITDTFYAEEPNTYNSCVDESDTADEDEAFQTVEDVDPLSKASKKKIYLLLLKSFIGTGVLFLPGAFHNGGLMFSFAFLVVMSLFSVYGMLALARVNSRYPGTLGQIVQRVYGTPMRS